ncbi:cell division protein SepF [Clostridium massiliamazoniense]|uniref:cell division protein SepF n=1 Tax=Clostridium massiliamazoniense TaxID=1347366 RepID=UPI0006D85EF8
MKNLFGKVKEFLGFEEEDDEFEEEVDEVVEEEVNYEPVIKSTQSTAANNASSKIVNIHSASSAKIMITKPMSYEDAAEITDALKSRKIVVVNTSALETRTAQRLLDFISGAIYALGGELQDVENRIYIVSPSNVEVNNELKNELTSKGLFGWK